MDFVDRMFDEADAKLNTKAEYFNAARQDGFAEAILSETKEYSNFEKAKLEKLRHEHRAKLKEISLQIENLRIDFWSAYTVFSVMYNLWFPLLFGAAIAIISAINGASFSVWLLPLGLSLFIVGSAVLGIACHVMQKITGKLLEQYGLYGVAEGMISLSDYRNLETFNLSVLPSTSFASQEVTW